MEPNYPKNYEDKNGEKGKDKLLNPYTKILPKNFQDAYEDMNKARNLIQARIDHLNDQRNRMKNKAPRTEPRPQRNMEDMYNMGNLSRAINKNMSFPSYPPLNNNNYFNGIDPQKMIYQQIDPLYYPLEMPVNGEPLTLPKIELGLPLQEYQEPKGNGGLNLSDLLALMTAMMKREPQPTQPQPQPTQPQPQPVFIPPSKLKTPTSISETSVKEKKKKERSKPKGPTKQGTDPYIKKDWWQVLINWVYTYRFYLTAKKYGKFSNTRNQIISTLSKEIYIDLDTIKNWLKLIQQDFMDEFKVFPDLNLSFNNYSGSYKIQEQSQKIMALINKFIKGLIKASSKGSDVPDKIQKILYKYIKNKGYFPKKFLSTFEIYRLDFNFYGGTKNHSDASIGMIIALLIISRTFVLQVLMHPVENYEEFRNYKYIQITCKYVGSIIHYLVRDTFKTNPPMVKEILALLNYYRNYHIYNEQIENAGNVFKNDVQYKDVDEISTDLVQESTISSFFESNQKWVEGMKKYIFQWAINLSKFIRLKFQNEDKNLKR